MDIRTKGLNHLCFPTYYRGPFVASNIANMYCTECIIGIIQNAGTPSRLRFARTRRDEGRREKQASNYGSPFLHPTEAHSFVASKYCESTTRSQVNLSHDSSRARRAVVVGHYSYAERRLEEGIAGKCLITRQNVVDGRNIKHQQGQR